MIVPPTALSAETLQNLLEEFITREGTDYGELEQSLQQKIESLRPQVMRGEVLIVFDEGSQSVNLVNQKDYTE